MLNNERLNSILSGYCLSEYKDSPKTERIMYEVTEVTVEWWLPSANVEVNSEEYFWLIPAVKIVA